MNRKLLVVVVALVLGCLGYYYQNSVKSQKDDIYSHLASIPGFKKSDIEGKYFLVHFWAKWCAPCAEEIPHMVEFAAQSDAKLGGKLKILAISLDQTLEESKTILPNQGVNLPSSFLLYLDSKQELAEKLGSYQYPETYFYDPEGHVLEKWVGPQKWNNIEVIQYFQKKLLPNP